MSECESTTCSSVIEGLPDEILAKILSYVPHDDFGNVRLVCRRFNGISYDASLWGEVSFPNLEPSLDQSRN
jgi:F-box-like